MESFEHQIYFDTKIQKGELIILGVKKGELYNDLKSKFLGNIEKFKKNYQVYGKGHIHFKKMTKRKKILFDFNKAITFVNMKTEDSMGLGFLNNLSHQNLTYANF